MTLIKKTDRHNMEIPMNALMNTYSQQKISFIRGEGSFLFDAEGNKYLDFGTGISVTNLGHCHSHVMEAVTAQINKLWHTSNVFPNKIVQELAERIASASMGGKVFFCNSGAEANEGAIKLARIFNNKVHHGKKPRIISMQNSFHGRTFITLSATGQEKIQKGFEPIAPFFTHIPFNDTEALRWELNKEDVCAVILELYQGESGVLPADADFVNTIRELTQKQGILMILDEVQTGYGRTGKLFAYQHTEVVPDIITVAKAISNGLPFGCVIATDEIANLYTPGTHGSTFGGNLVASAAAHAVLDVMLEDGFLASVADKGEFFMGLARKRLGKYGATVRGKALLVGIQLPEQINNFEYIEKLLDNGVAPIPGGSNSVRFYPPLTATLDELQQGLEIAERTLASM